MDISRKQIAGIAVGAVAAAGIAAFAIVKAVKRNRPDSLDDLEFDHVSAEDILEDGKFYPGEGTSKIVLIDEQKPSLEKLAYDKIAASYGEKLVQERFGVPFDIDWKEDEEELDIPEEEDVGVDNGRFDHGPALDKPDGFELKVGTYFTTDDVLAGFDEDLFDVKASDYIGEEAASVLHDMKMRADKAYYVIDRDRRIFYEIVINRIDTYDDGYAEWVSEQSLPRIERV